MNQSNHQTKSWFDQNTKLVGGISGGLTESNGAQGRIDNTAVASSVVTATQRLRYALASKKSLWGFFVEPLVVRFRPKSTREVAVLVRNLKLGKQL